MQQYSPAPMLSLPSCRVRKATPARAISPLTKAEGRGRPRRRAASNRGTNMMAVFSRKAVVEELVWSRPISSQAMVA